MKSIEFIKSEKVAKIFKYSLIKYIVLAIGFLKSIVNAKFLGPELLGVFGNLTIVLGYCTYANLGIIHSMNREYVLYKDEEPNKAKQVLNTSFTFLWLISLLFFILAAFSLVYYRSEFGVYLAIIFVIAITDQFKALYINYFRLNSNYKLINLLEAVHGIISFLLILLLINKFKILGILVAMISCGLIIMIIGFTKIKDLKISFDKKILKDLIMIGIPLLIYNLGFHILSTIDRIIIMNFYDDASLGYYTFANSMVTATLVFVTSMFFLIYPNLIKSFNEKRSHEIMGKVSAYTKLVELACIVLFVLGVVFIPIFIKLVVPKYGSSINIYNILILAIVYNNIGYFSNVYIVSNRKHKYLVYLQCIAIALNTIANIIFVELGLGVVGVALGTLLSNAVYSFLQFLVFVKLNKKEYGIKLVSSVSKVYNKFNIFCIIQVIILLCNLNRGLSLALIICSIVILYFKDITNIKEYITNAKLNF